MDSEAQSTSEGHRRCEHENSSTSTSVVKKMPMIQEEDSDIFSEVSSCAAVPSTSGILKRGSNSEQAADKKRLKFSYHTENQTIVVDSDEDEDSEEKTESEIEVEQPDQVEVDVSQDLVNKKSEDTDSNFNDLDVSEVKIAVTRVLQQLELFDSLDVLCEFFAIMGTEDCDKLKTTLMKPGSSLLMIDKMLILMVRIMRSFKEFVPQLSELVKKLPDDKFEEFLSEIARPNMEKKVDEATTSGTVPEEKEIEDHIMSLDCDKMADLVKKFFSNLKNERRGAILTDLKSWASNELTPQK